MRFSPRQPARDQKKGKSVELWKKNGIFFVYLLICFCVFFEVESLESDQCGGGLIVTRIFYELNIAFLFG